MHSSKFIHFHFLIILLIKFFNPYAIFTHLFTSLFFTSHIAPIFLLIYIYYFCSLAHEHLYFHSFAHKHFQIAHMPFSTLCTLTLLFESSFASFTIFYEVFLIGLHNSCEWDHKPHKRHFLDLGLHFSFISLCPNCKYILWVEKLGK